MMESIERRARELLRAEYMLSLSGAGPKQRHLYECAVRAIMNAIKSSEGHVVVTRNEAGQAVAVTRQDDDGRILSVIAEFEAPEGYVDREDLLAHMDRAFSDGMSKAQPQIPEGYVLVPVELTPEMVKAVYPLHYFTYLGSELREHWRTLLAARPKIP